MPASLLQTRNPLNSRSPIFAASVAAYKALSKDLYPDLIDLDTDEDGGANGRPIVICAAAAALLCPGDLQREIDMSARNKPGFELQVYRLEQEHAR